MSDNQPQSISCPHCHAPLDMPTLCAQWQARKPRPSRQGKKRPGVGGRPRHTTAELKDAIDRIAAERKTK